MSASALLILFFYVSIILHVAFFGGWFGLGLRLGRLARTAVSAEPAVGAVLAAEGAGVVRLMTIFAVVGYAFALVAFFVNPTFINVGMAAYGPPMHSALLLGLLLVVVQVWLVRGGWNRLRAAVGSPEADRARGRVAMATGIGHLVWFMLLVLMFWDRLAAAATA